MLGRPGLDAEPLGSLYWFSAPLGDTVVARTRRRHRGLDARSIRPGTLRSRTRGSTAAQPRGPLVSQSWRIASPTGNPRAGTSSKRCPSSRWFVSGRDEVESRETRPVGILGRRRQPKQGTRHWTAQICFVVITSRFAFSTSAPLCAERKRSRRGRDRDCLRRGTAILATLTRATAVGRQQASPRGSERLLRFVPCDSGDGVRQHARPHAKAAAHSRRWTELVQGCDSAKTT